MNCYEIWADLKSGENDLEFARAVEAYLGHLVESGLVAEFRVKRPKLGFGPESLGEWHLSLEFRDLRQLEDTFELIARRSGEVERLHHEVYSRVVNVKFGLYRDFPGVEREMRGANTAL